MMPGGMSSRKCGKSRCGKKKKGVRLMPHPFMVSYSGNLELELAEQRNDQQ